MPFLLEIDAKMEEYESMVSVVDVYDIASEIGKEFEKMIDAHGTEAVTSMMPKVINALEQLERLAMRNERENTLVQELRSRIAQLESDKIEKAEDRHRFEKELEQIEDHWRQESRELVSLVTRLQDENRRLAGQLQERSENSGNSSRGAATPLSPEVDIAVMQRLRETAESLREQLRVKDRDVTSRTADIESLQGQLDRSAVLGRELRRKQRGYQLQVRALLDERTDFLAQMQDQQRELVSLRQHLGIAQKENEDLAWSQSEAPDLSNKVVYCLDDPARPRFTTAELKEILHERNELKARVSDLEDELETYRPRNSGTESETCNLSQRDIGPPDWFTESAEQSLRRYTNIRPAIFTPPNSQCSSAMSSPKHTSTPTKKTQLQQDHLRSPFPLNSQVTPPHTTSIPLSILPAKLNMLAPRLQKSGPSTQGEEEEAPVQGPLPYEPDDAPWKRNESGIRKFFRKLFGENSVSFGLGSGSSGASPKRSLSALSKLALAGSSGLDTAV